MAEASGAVATETPAVAEETPVPATITPATITPVSGEEKPGLYTPGPENASTKKSGKRRLRASMFTP